MQKVVFAPMVQLLSYFSYRWKFVLIFVMLFIPLGVVMNVSIGGINEQIVFNAQESTGVAYIKPLSSLMRVSLTNKQIEKSIQDVDKVNEAYGAELKVSDNWTQWKNESGKDTPSLKQIEALATLIVDVGNNSNLILDPDLDSYYLMDSVVNKLPSITVTIAKIREKLQRTSPTATVSLSDKAELFKLITQVEMFLEGEKAGLEVAYSQNPGIKDRQGNQDQAVIQQIHKSMDALSTQLLTSDKLDYQGQRAQFSIDEVIDSSLKLHELHNHQLEQLIDARVDKYTNRKHTVWISFCAGILVFLYCFSGLYCNITSPITELRKIMAEIQNGNLGITCLVVAKDELGMLTCSLNEMVSGQREIIKTIQNTALSLSSNSEEMAASAQEVSSAANGITHYIDSLVQDIAAAEHLASQANNAVSQLSTEIDNAQKRVDSAWEQSQITVKAAQNGVNVMGVLAGQMDSIRNSTGAATEHLQSLSDFTKQIEGITQVIATIASQTNLLALNAAIEAARAGEAGRGFSVVAEEVRQLAEQSTRQASEVASIVSKITENITQAAKAIYVGNVDVEKGVTEVQGANQAFSEIIGVVNVSAADIKEIQQANLLITAKAQEVQDAMNSVKGHIRRPVEGSQQVYLSTKEIATAIENVASGAGDMNHVATDMRDIVERFKI